MNDFLDELTMEHLDGEPLSLAEVIGLDAFKKLLRVYGSSGRLYIPAVGTVTAPIRNERLFEDYRKGTSLHDLQSKYGLGESSVRNILRTKLKSKITNPNIAKGEKL